MTRDMDTAQAVLNAVHDASLLGILSTEITTKADIPNNRVTAALSRLTVLGCVRREKIYGYTARYRYWYVREIPADDAGVIDVPVTRRVEGHQPKPGAMPPPPAPRKRWGVDASGVSIRLQIPPRGGIAVTPEQARKVYEQLRVIFGD